MINQGSAMLSFFTFKIEHTMKANNKFYVDVFIPESSLLAFTLFHLLFHGSISFFFLQFSLFL